MPHDFNTLKFSDPFPNFQSLAQDKATPWWSRMWIWSRMAGTWRLISMLTVASMVIWFYAVVTEAVRQGELRQQALAAHSRAVWQCKMLKSAADRKGCLTNMSSPVQPLIVSN